MTIWIYTGGRPSNSAKELSHSPGFRRMIKGKGLKKADTVVNWGSTSGFEVNCTVLNHPLDVLKASNKRAAFSLLSGADVNVVPWTANQAVVKEWQAAGATIVCRKVLTGHSGAGIIILEKGEELIEAPLYTKYIFKTKEYRVHATRTKAIDTQQKVRDPKVEPKCWKVRSHANGFIFQRNNIQPSADRDKLACEAIVALGLDFGAVDIVEDKHGNFFVLEVNTAPGLEGQTVDSYTVALKELAENANVA
jgi:hypothetical protein